MKGRRYQLHPGVKVDQGLLYRVLDIGRHEAYGDDDQSMVSFVEFGLKLRCAGGTFKLHTCAETTAHLVVCTDHFKIANYICVRMSAVLHGHYFQHNEGYRISLYLNEYLYLK